jgi:hypothetical protein
MLKITRAANGEVVFTVSGRLEAENLPELITLFTSEEKTYAGASGLRSAGGPRFRVAADF